MLLEEFECNIEYKEHKLNGAEANVHLCPANYGEWERQRCSKANGDNTKEPFW